MVQDLYLLFNMYLRQFLYSSQFDPFKGVSFDAFESFEKFVIKNMELHLSHSFMENNKRNICTYSKVKPHSSYPRYFCSLENGRFVSKKVRVSVVYCPNCHHYHSVIPYALIVPYSQYSLSFVLSVLYEKIVLHEKVETITRKYDISISTLYRWIRKYSVFLRLFLRTSESCTDDLLKKLKEAGHKILKSMFDAYGIAIFQFDRKLFSILT